MVQDKFFSLYLNQEVLCNFEIGGIQKLQAWHIWRIQEGFYGTSHLLLRSIKQLTDEEKIRCYHLHSGAISYDYTQDFADILTCANHWLENDSYLIKFACTVDYLRSIGILLPFTTIISGEIKTYKVEEILANGWAILRS